MVHTGKGTPNGEMDPLILVEQEMSQHKLIPVEGLPGFHGGAVGYVAYDAIRYFEPRVPPMPADPQDLPESVFMFADTLLVFDHLRHDIKVVSHAHLYGDVEKAYLEATARVDEMVNRLSEHLTLPPELQDGDFGATGLAPVESNFTIEGYAEAVDKCIEYIYAGTHSGRELPEIFPPH